MLTMTLYMRPCIKSWSSRSLIRDTPPGTQSCSPTDAIRRHHSSSLGFDTGEAGRCTVEVLGQVSFSPQEA